MMRSRGSSLPHPGVISKWGGSPISTGGADSAGDYAVIRAQAVSPPSTADGTCSASRKDLCRMIGERMGGGFRSHVDEVARPSVQPRRQPSSHDESLAKPVQLNPVRTARTGDVRLEIDSLRAERNDLREWRDKPRPSTRVILIRRVTGSGSGDWRSNSSSAEC